MTHLEKVFEGINGLPGIDIFAVESFIEDMKEAKTSSHYTTEKRNIFRSLDLEGVKQFLINSSNSKVRLRSSMTIDKVVKIKRISPVESNIYF